MDITNTVDQFRVGARVKVTGLEESGTVEEIVPEHPFPLRVRLPAGTLMHCLPREATTIPRSRSLDDIEAWLDE